MNGAPSRNRAIDGLRGCAILAVLFCHFGVVQPGSFPWGVVGVRLFLLLSGMYLMHCVYNLHAERGRAGSLWNFYSKRFGRLLPVGYGALLLAVLSGIEFNSRELAWHFLFLSNFLAVSRDAWPETFSHFWSLSLQIQFYLLLPLLLLHLPRRFFGPLLLLGLLAGPAFRAACHFFGFSPMFCWLMLPSCLDAFAAGALIVYLEKDQAHLHRALHRWLGPSLLLAAASMFLAYRMRMGAYQGAFASLMESAEIIFLFALLLAARSPESPFLSRLLSFPPLAWVGTISYSLYAFHPWVHQLYLSRISPSLESWGLHGIVLLPPLFALSLIVAALSWLTLEQRRCSLFFTSFFQALPGAIHRGAAALSSPALIRPTAFAAVPVLLLSWWFLQPPLSIPSVHLAKVPEEIQELQNEIQEPYQEETPIISLDTMEPEPVDQPLDELSDQHSEVTL